MTANFAWEVSLQKRLYSKIITLWIKHQKQDIMRILLINQSLLPWTQISGCHLGVHVCFLLYLRPFPHPVACHLLKFGPCVSDCIEKAWKLQSVRVWAKRGPRYLNQNTYFLHAFAALSPRYVVRMVTADQRNINYAICTAAIKNLNDECLFLWQHDCSLFVFITWKVLAWVPFYYKLWKWVDKS